MATIIYTGTDHRVSISNLKDQDGNLVTGATVEMTLYESDGSTEVDGATWPITLSDDGDGAYSGVLPNTVSITRHKRYRMRIVAEKGSTKRTWWEDIVAQDGEF